jgi:hypothetical protein
VTDSPNWFRNHRAVFTSNPPPCGPQLRTHSARRERLNSVTESLLATVFVFIKSVVTAMGYAGITLLMAIESACIPLPSELIMPFAGYLAMRAP